ncbi:bile salt-activated lipase-like [Clupea harengus]|uniref:Carboxylic ester hydrolase n=1 Tax=Clupea harengus TaxID=7950 RepID=A0A6P8GGW1_CLUHA|nr:bile salt-activated lipase-like [Clupea harengus]
MAMLGIMLAAALCLGSASAASLGTVLTEGGLVSGDNYGVSGLFRYMDVFRGIPFAAPPGRFEKPKPHPGWDGILKAKNFSKRCLQVNLLMTDTRGAEDCLYLNVWVPQGLKVVSTNLPVMVYMYGGGFLLGGSSGANFLNNYLYDGEQIANRGRVIVVTPNYRVGTLGFLSTGDDGLPGNYGLWDQHAAIAWVHRNIRAFGGDPDNITVFGESAGAVSVNLQLISPKNKGLIRRGISQSGVALCSWAINRNPREVAELVAAKVGCPTDDKMAACLKMTDPVALTLAGSLNMHGSADAPLVNNLVLSPVIDGDFLPDEPSNLFVNAAEMDYIIGANDMDGHLFAGLDVPSLNQPLQHTPLEDLKTLVAALTKEKGPKGADLAFNEYSHTWGDKPTKEEIKRAVVEVETDYIFLVPTQAALYQHNSVATTGRTYSYLFSQPSRNPLNPSWMGADHAEDLQFVFGKPFTTPLAYWPKHRDVSGYMIAYWTNFAKTGDPNKGESKVPVTWPAFNKETHQYVDINHSMDGNSVKQKMRLRFVNYWTNTYASLPTIYE